MSGEAEHDRKWLERMDAEGVLDAEQEALDATGGLLACSPEIWKAMQPTYVVKFIEDRGEQHLGVEGLYFQRLEREEDGRWHLFVTRDPQEARQFVSQPEAAGIRDEYPELLSMSMQILSAAITPEEEQAVAEVTALVQQGLKGVQ